MEINQLEMLEIFHKEPAVIDAEAEIYQYTFADNRGYIFSMYVSAYEDKVIVRFEHSELTFSIFDVTFSNVTSVITREQEISFFDKDTLLASVRIRPNVSLDIDI